MNVPFALGLFFARHVPPTELALIISTAPIVNYLVALATGRENAARRRLLAILLGFVSTAILVITPAGHAVGRGLMVAHRRVFAAGSLFGLQLVRLDLVAARRAIPWRRAWRNRSGPASSPALPAALRAALAAGQLPLVGLLDGAARLRNVDAGAHRLLHADPGEGRGLHRAGGLSLDARRRWSSRWPSMAGRTSGSSCRSPC